MKTEFYAALGLYILEYKTVICGFYWQITIK